MKDGRLQGSWTKCHELSCRDKLLAAGYHEAGVAVDRGEGKRSHSLDSMAVLPDALGDSGAAPVLGLAFPDDGGGDLPEKRKRICKAV